MVTYRRGYTLLELLIYIGIFAVTLSFTIGSIYVASRVQNNQNSSREVSEQSRFVLQKVQQYIRESSLIEVPATGNDASSTLTVRLKNSLNGRVSIYASGTTVYLRESDSDNLSAV